MILPLPGNMEVSIADMADPDYGVGCRSNSPASDPPIVCESDLAIRQSFKRSITERSLLGPSPGKDTFKTLC